MVLEAQGRFDEAILDYKKVIAADDKDPSAWNNLGNASAGLQKWHDAAEYYGKAAELAPAFSFAAANRALATYQLGERDEETTNQALREMRYAAPGTVMTSTMGLHLPFKGKDLNLQSVQVQIVKRLPAACNPRAGQSWHDAHTQLSVSKCSICIAGSPSPRFMQQCRIKMLNAPLTAH